MRPDRRQVESMWRGRHGRRHWNARCRGCEKAFRRHRKPKKYEPGSGKSPGPRRGGWCGGRPGGGWTPSFKKKDSKEAKEGQKGDPLQGFLLRIIEFLILQHDFLEIPWHLLPHVHPHPSRCSAVIPKEGWAQPALQVRFRPLVDVAASFRSHPLHDDPRLRKGTGREEEQEPLRRLPNVELSARVFDQLVSAADQSLVVQSLLLVVEYPLASPADVLCAEILALDFAEMISGKRSLIRPVPHPV